MINKNHVLKELTSLIEERVHLTQYDYQSNFDCTLPEVKDFINTFSDDYLRHLNVEYIGMGFDGSIILNFSNILNNNHLINIRFKLYKVVYEYATNDRDWMRGVDYYPLRKSDNMYTSLSEFLQIEKSKITL